MPVSQRPKIHIHETDSSVLANDLEELAKILGIDLPMADNVETERILDRLTKSLSGEIVETREKHSE
jgi:hypothetical protein